jgi:hypothetical protein
VKKQSADYVDLQAVKEIKAQSCGVDNSIPIFYINFIAVSQIFEKGQRGYRVLRIR